MPGSRGQHTFAAPRSVSAIKIRAGVISSKQACSEQGLLCENGKGTEAKGCGWQEGWGEGGGVARARKFDLICRSPRRANGIDGATPFFISDVTDPRLSVAR